MQTHSMENEYFKQQDFCLWFDQLGIEDVPRVGGKNASLGEMYRNLTDKGVNVPNGFAITAQAYHYLLDKAGVKDKIKEVLSDLDTTDMNNLSERGHKVRQIIRKAEFPPELRSAIINDYKNLCNAYGKDEVDVAVRSSATAEDLPDASFAGQQETYLNIRGEENLIDACKNCFASLFTNRAISYRVDKNFDHFSIGLSIGVQKMVRSDLACSGVMFSIDTESGFSDAAFITGAYGLGENVVQGAVNPDEFYVFKPTLKQGFRPIITKTLGSKEVKMIYTKDGKHPTKNVPVEVSQRKKFVLLEDEILKLANWACIIEDHYSEKAGHFKPMDMEWAKDGETGDLFIVQARPETVQSQKDMTILKKYVLKEEGKTVVIGHSVGELIGSGKANIIKDVHGINDFKEGEILVTEMTDPDWEPIMKIASAIVTNKGGRTCFSGKTKILTNKGYMTFKEIEEFGHEGLLTLSFNKETKKTEWKPIIAFMKKTAPMISVSVSISGKILDNTLEITPDHKMVNVRDGRIVDTKIQNMLDRDEMICISEKIPSLQIDTHKDKKLAYLLGGIMTDGCIYRSRTHGEVQFIQKDIPEKQAFINHMQDCMTDTFGKSFVGTLKKVSSGTNRGKTVSGQASAFRLYSKQIAYELHEKKQRIVTTLLQGSTGLSLHFLGGVIDGDGSFYNNRIQIYASSDLLLEAITVACLKLGIVPQVTNNRNIYNVQIVEKLDKLLKYTKRVKGQIRNRTIKTRFFGTRQLFDENVKGQLKLRRDKNLYISEELLKRCDDKNIQELLSSDLRMQRIVDTGEQKTGDVYNITVADNHTYIVFTKKLTPVVVNNCHAAIISRELGIPCVVGTLNGTEKIHPGQDITVDCSKGDEGIVYEGLLKFEVEEHDLKSMPETKTKIMMNLGNPEQAFEMSHIPNKGVGLAREEFIINSYIKVHPLALLGFKDLKDEKAKKIITDLTYGYANKADYFVDKLAQGVARIAAAFYPKDVIVRLSDFKSNEYANLIGGKEYEPTEDNPMIGWRGASRYYDDNYKAGFALECQALKRVRDEMGLTNVILMVPFCRTVEEGKRVLQVMEEYGLKQGENDLKVYAMCEIPSNVILADEFLDVFDGFSIGSNDLTQLTLGLDRDSELVSHIYDERNEAVKSLVKKVIETCNKRGKYIGFCGQAVSDFVEFAEFVVQCGIQSMSLNPDTVIKTTIAVADVEKRLGV